MIYFARLLFVTLLISTPFALYAEQDRPVIGLVLSGGGARGAAHIGVIEALEEMNVPIDLIVGTSMGAVIGGLYASGVPIEKIKYDFCELNWENVFKHDIKRKNLYFRRKLDDEIFVAKNFIGMTNGSLHLSYGLTSGQSLYQLFKSYTIDKEPIGCFSELPIPFKAVATDLLTGQVVALEQGDFALALLASMAVPGIISPIQLNEYMLVDGGVSENLPIEIAKQMGADVVIVVDVSTPLRDQTQIHDLTSVLGQISNILTYNNVKASESKLRPQDILIQPVLDDLGTIEFDHFADGIDPGKEAAFAQHERLTCYAQENYLPVACLPFVVTPLRIDNVIVTSNHSFCRKTYADYLRLESTLVNVEDINRHIDALYGLNIFDRIYYDVQTARGIPELEVKPRLKPRRTILFQESMLLESDFRDTNRFSFVLGVTDPHINRLLGEWRVIGALGSNVSFAAEYYQPLEPSLSWFFNPYIYFNREPFYLYYDFQEVARFIDNHYYASIRFGRNFSNWGRLYGFAAFDYDNYDVTVAETFAQTPLVSGFEKEYIVGGTLEWDALDNLYFPHHGFKGEATLSNNRAYFSQDPHFTQIESKALAAWSSGKHSLVLGTYYNSTLNGEANFISQFTLGGLFQLTGLQSDELMGENSALATLIYFYKFSKINFIPNRPWPVYLGGSFEVGNVWGERNISPRKSPIYSNSVFIGTDTLIGPIYLGAGATYNGQKAVHLLIGPFF